MSMILKSSGVRELVATSESMKYGHEMVIAAALSSFQSAVTSFRFALLYHVIGGETVNRGMKYSAPLNAHISA